jgi:branched-chain amino acid transport system permease protein
VLTVQLLAVGIAVGALYSLASVGFALIFGTTRVFHIAHGATYLVAAYLYVWGVHVSVLVGVLASAVGAVLFGWLTDVLVYRPIQRARNSFFTLFVASFGILIVVQNAVSVIAGSDPQQLTGAITVPVDFGSVQLPRSELTGLGVAVVALLALRLFLNRSNTGIGIRAMADDAELVGLVGLDRRRYSTTAFALGSLLVVPAAILTTYVQGVTPASGLSIATVALVAAIAGGVGSLPGAAVGALILGVVESLATLKLSAEWQDAVAYGVLLLLLVFRPSGLLSKVRAA